MTEFGLLNLYVRVTSVKLYRCDVKYCIHVDSLFFCMSVKYRCEFKCVCSFKFFLKFSYMFSV